MRTPANCLEEVDLIAVLTDSSNKYQRIRIHHEIIHLLQAHPALQVILILNKIDKIRHKVKLLNYSAMLTNDRQKDKWGYLPHGGFSKFDHVFMVSALTGDGLDQLRQYMVTKATPGDWAYSTGVATDLDVEEQIAEVFRGKLLSLYKHENSMANQNRWVPLHWYRLHWYYCIHWSRNLYGINQSSNPCWLDMAL